MYKFKEKEGFSVMQTFFIVLHIIVTCLLIFVVMAQEGKATRNERNSGSVGGYGRFVL